MTKLNTQRIKQTESDSGPKLQLTVRFPPKQVSIIESLSKNLGISQAEVCRRLLQRGIDNSREVNVSDK
jgi:hypothetical protein